MKSNKCSSIMTGVNCQMENASVNFSCLLSQRDLCMFHYQGTFFYQVYTFNSGLNLEMLSSGGSLHMKAMVVQRICDLKETKTPLKLVELPEPEPGEQEILVNVSACGVCHTELDEIEGRTPPSYFPMVLGHQVVGQVVNSGRHVTAFQVGDRVGIAWIYSACGKCKFCLSDQENLCPEFKATGRDVYGGYAEYMTVPEGFAYPIPDVFSDSEAAPLLCAGAIGYRSLRLTGLRDGQLLGLTGFGGFRTSCDENGQSSISEFQGLRICQK